MDKREKIPWGKTAIFFKTQIGDWVRRQKKVIWEKKTEGLKRISIEIVSYTQRIEKTEKKAGMRLEEYKTVVETDVLKWA